MSEEIPQFINFWDRLCYLLHTDEIQKVADKLDLVYNTVANYRRGRQPETTTLIKIYEKTGASLHWLLFGEGPMIRKNESPTTTTIKPEVFPVSSSSQAIPSVRVIIEISSSHVKTNIEEISNVKSATNSPGDFEKPGQTP